MRRLPALLLALLVVSSGCADSLPWVENEPTSERTPQPTPNPPPGADTEWIFDAERLLSAHASVLAGTNYRKEVRIRPNHSTGPLKWSNSTLVAHVGDGRVRMHGRGELVALRGVGSHYRSYLTNRTAMVRVPRNDDDEYHYVADSTHPFRKPVENDTRMERVLTSSDFVWNGTTVRDGTTLYRYSATGYTELSGVTSLSATAFVDERGLVHDLSGTIRISDFRPTTVDFSYRFFETTSPPTKPEWTRRVPRVSVTRESGTIAVENTGNAIFSAGTKGIVVVANESASIADGIEFSEPLEPGDVTYLSLADVGNRTENGLTDGEIRIGERRPPPNESIRPPFEWRRLSFESADGDASVIIVRGSRRNEN
ncbi:hypothetical protein [Haladaptatus salinisoli]|uniref:hypothetical protein n=1 Tax=Haladaptatus salinisoli TaxID=2884876 RepID=UPI001D0B0AC8|nr:hypothetical protein [Haladaptatus salinisoli]